MSVCKKGFLVLVLVLDWTQCLPQRAPAMLQGRMTGFPKNWGPGPPERQDKVDTICTVPIDCGTQNTRRLYPFGATGGAHHTHQGLHNFHKQTYIRPSTHTTQNYNWSKYTAYCIRHVTNLDCTGDLVAGKRFQYL